MSRFVIACGGTGGHLAPGIALAEWLRSRGYRPLLLISDKQIDAKLTEKYPDLEFAVIPGAPLLLGGSGLVRFVIKQTQGLLFSWRLILRERPVAIIGFGGFTTASIIVAGWIRGVPVALHEANRVVGRAVRSLARFADRVYIPRGVLLPGAGTAKLRHVGLPVRQEIGRQPRHEAAAVFGLDPAKPTLVVMGGSQGARALNRWIESAASHLAELGLQTLVVTGPNKGAAGTKSFPGPDGKPVAFSQIPFCADMAALYSVGDVMVSRSGAGTLAELVKCRLPSVLVPYPHAADNHQVANANNFARRGAGLVVPEEDMAELTTVVERLVFDESRLAEMRSQLGHIDRAGALDLMFDDLERLAGLKPGPASMEFQGVSNA